MVWLAPPALALVAAAALSAVMGAPERRGSPASVLSTPDLACRVRDRAGALVRSPERRCLFLRMTGHDSCRVPDGFAVNHIVPLRCGGCDVPSNMELMTVADWKARTGPERLDCGRHRGGHW